MLGTRTLQRSDSPGASTSMAALTTFHRWTMFPGLAAPEAFDGALAVGRQEHALVADVLL